MIDTSLLHDEVTTSKGLDGDQVLVIDIRLQSRNEYPDQENVH